MLGRRTWKVRHFLRYPRIYKDIFPLLYSSIHDHADSHCFMKILRGNLMETQFHWPEKGEDVESIAMTIKESHVYATNDVTYISGK